MPIQLRVIETTTRRGQSDVTINVLSPDQAATIVARAHQRSMTTGSPIIKLPDGQNILIDRGDPETAIELRLLDEAGHEIGPVTIPEPQRSRARRE